MDETTNNRGVGVMTIHIKHLEKEIEWFRSVLDARIKSYFGEKDKTFSINDLSPPSFSKGSAYGSFVSQHQLQPEERLVLILALLPHVKPELLDVFFTRNTHFDRGFTEFGGLKGNSYSGFMPTAETAMFVLAGGDLQKRVSYLPIFEKEHVFAMLSIIQLNLHSPSEPALSAQMDVSKDFVDFFLTGYPGKPVYSVSFPAQKMETTLQWDDLILPVDTLEPVKEVMVWIRKGAKLKSEWGENRHLKKGYRVLFYGPPGTGKTLTASLLGKETGVDLYRIDLSLVVSKFIGETEKNLSKIFDRAENKNWILFFDEADAIFGKRTEISDAHDRYANQEISYLLQRVEDFSGTVLLATNLKSNLDDAFIRRFQSVIYFPVPGKEERYRLWLSAFPEKAPLSSDINFKKIAADYELAGAAIVNIAQYCLLMSLEHKNGTIDMPMLLKGIRKELHKEGRTL